MKMLKKHHLKNILIQKLNYKIKSDLESYPLFEIDELSTFGSESWDSVYLNRLDFGTDSIEFWLRIETLLK